MSNSAQKEPKVSIVVPIYNVEKYLEQCLDSLLAQTLSDIEIITVNDGSPDRCGEIIDAYAAKDSRVKAVHKENGGYGSAVNLGIEMARAKYVGIVESDDWCDPTMYEKLYNKAIAFDADVCKAGFNVYNSLAKKDKQIQKWKSKVQDIESCVSDRAVTIFEVPQLIHFHPSIWSCIYKKAFLKANNIEVNNTPGASYQDLPYMVEVMGSAKRICIVPEYLYNWRVEDGQGSSTKSPGKKALIMPLQCCITRDLSKNNGLYNELKEGLFYHFFGALYSFYRTIENEYKDEFSRLANSVFEEALAEGTLKYTFFTRRDKISLQEMLNNKEFLSTKLIRLRRAIIRLRINRHEFSFYLFSLIIFKIKWNND